MAELVVALDFKDAKSALDMAGRLRGTASWMKVGMELFSAEGPSVVAGLKGMGFKVFLDLKFFDIPNTVQGAIRSSVALGVDMVNIHILGGRRMAEAAMQGCLEGTPVGAEPPLVLGVTMLTSMEEGDLPVRHAPAPGEMVLDLAVKAKQYGLNGVVCSGLEARKIKASCGPGFICLTPGIRPAGHDRGDQRRVVTPAEAIRLGSDFLVVGRPVTGAESPEVAARAILEEMQSA
ncbi:orotidine-5'-phosphate decarboxylase [Pseudodesulfovibrio tunisiensis]|uniref:orotidine-5'-phosphate decarboxylase n=1 Tax=Pseudodesulfovibrio tunisiensis TaxID=463192 RepID=UPI001FB303CB|nr:orotidine-5'-phosphate decarboxylase [Pseudodesulfovibrio tunisiensis]